MFLKDNVAERTANGGSEKAFVPERLLYCRLACSAIFSGDRSGRSQLRIALSPPSFKKASGEPLPRLNCSSVDGA
jgi:hypothetical protein